MQKDGSVCLWIYTTLTTEFRNAHRPLPYTGQRHRKRPKNSIGFGRLIDEDGLDMETYRVAMGITLDGRTLPLTFNIDCTKRDSIVAISGIDPLEAGSTRIKNILNPTEGTMLKRQVLRNMYIWSPPGSGNHT
ncbi:hypothetical protein PgNI_11307 [Pyricularia grisea]|uniref:Uncharacterized protein n=1 Tax=Pyricularia grisea TaxID=148305 RepID=A0A6P8APV8_PYRGI|nr:hypothetical protein PgNI_11307 [Pyricularia grisea]TLD04062.1 hypothetical protein PgNI_11307 [Pyricularia grisea]